MAEAALLGDWLEADRLETRRDREHGDEQFAALMRGLTALARILARR